MDHRRNGVRRRRFAEVFLTGLVKKNLDKFDETSNFRHHWRWVLLLLWRIIAGKYFNSRIKVKVVNLIFFFLLLLSLLLNIRIDNDMWNVCSVNIMWTRMVWLFIVFLLSFVTHNNFDYNILGQMLTWIRNVTGRSLLRQKTICDIIVTITHPPFPLYMYI